MRDVDLNWGKWGAASFDQVMPLDPPAGGAIALCSRVDETSHQWKKRIVRISKEGRVTAGSDYLPVELCGNGRALAMFASATGTVVITERKRAPQEYNLPVWISVSCGQRKIQLAEIGRWNDVHSGMDIQGTISRGQAFWLGTYCPSTKVWPYGFLETRLFVASSLPGQIPQPRLTNVKAFRISTPVVFGNRIFVLISAGSGRMDLWSMDRHLQLCHEARMETTKYNDEQLGSPGLVRRGHMLVMAWGYYAKVSPWIGQVHVATYCPATKSRSKVIVASADRRVVVASLQTQAIPGKVVLTWESRPQRGGGGMRAIEFSSIKELPAEPRVLPFKSKRFFLPFFDLQ